MMEKSTEYMFGEILTEVKHIKENITAINKHLALTNGSLKKYEDNLTGLNTTVYGRKSDKGLCGEVSGLRKMIYWIFAIIITGGTLSGLEITDVIHLFGG